MRTRLFLAAVCILTLPILFSSLTDNKLTNSTPFATVAIAGHTISTGAFCECGTQDCLCDPNETPKGGRRGNQVISDPSDGAVSSTSEAPASDIDFGTVAMLLALVVFAWTRFRM